VVDAAGASPPLLEFLPEVLEGKAIGDSCSIASAGAHLFSFCIEGKAIALISFFAVVSFGAHLDEGDFDCLGFTQEFESSSLTGFIQATEEEALGSMVLDIWL